MFPKVSNAKTKENYFSNTRKTTRGSITVSAQKYIKTRLYLSKGEEITNSIFSASPLFFTCSERGLSPARRSSAAGATVPGTGPSVEELGGGAILLNGRR